MAANDEEYRRIVAAIGRIGAQLTDAERRWRDKQPFLEGKGYMLRARYRPGWIPSWTENGQHPSSCEDFASLPPRPHLIDATRMSDGSLVCLKRFRTASDEASIASKFSEDGLQVSSANHCVPILDVFKDDEDASISYLVMPFLRIMDDPDFTHVNDVVEFVDQVLEGLAFMHAQGVAHRDLARRNIMMNAAPLFPKGFHPVDLDFLPSGNGRAPHIPRLSVWPPITYYFIDFGLAVSIPPEVQPKLALGNLGIDRDVPELSTTVPYDPFKVDVFILGNVFRKDICAKFTNVNFLEPLIASMTAIEPKERPNADSALASWKQIRGGVCFFSRGALLKRVEENNSTTFLFDVTAFLKLGILLSRRILRWTAHMVALLNCFRRR